MKNSPSLLDALDAESFAQWWEVWPRKVSRDYAQKCYEKALQKPGVTPYLLLDAARRYAEVAKLMERRFVPHASTWLNQGRWNDDLDGEMEALNGPRDSGPRSRGDQRQDAIRGYWQATQDLLGNRDESGGRSALDPPPA